VKQKMINKITRAPTMLLDIHPPINAAIRPTEVAEKNAIVWGE
jgi:hypothetical protein